MQGKHSGVPHLLPIGELLADEPELEEKAQREAPDHEGALPDGVAAEAGPAPAGRGVGRALGRRLPQILLAADAAAGGRRSLLQRCPLLLSNPAARAAA